MKIEIGRDGIKALLLTAGKKDIRFYLNAVLFERTKRGTWAVSTDGHRAGIRRFPDSGEACACIVPRDALEQAAKIGRQLTIDTDAGTITAETGAVVPFVAVDARFPDWRRIVPRMDGEPVPGHFRPGYVGDFGKVAKLLGAKEYEVTIHQRGDDAAVVQIAGRDDYFGILMPQRSRDAAKLADLAAFQAVQA